MKCETIRMNQEGTSTLCTYILDPEISFGVKRKWPAMIIVPGGGYLITATKEGEAVASQFLARGFSCFVLRYSTYLKNREGLVTGNYEMDENAHYPKQELQLMQVIHLIREHAEEWNIDPDAVFACGFSAGGHIISSTAVHWNDPAFTERLPFKPEGEELKLTGCVLGYPMVDGNLRDHMEATKDLPGSIISQLELIEKALYDHTNPSEEEYAKLTVRNYVSKDTSPMFIWHTTDDAVIDSLKTLELIRTLQENRIDCEYHLFNHGGHGLACANRYYAKNNQEIDTEIALWLPMAENWMNRIMEKIMKNEDLTIFEYRLQKEVKYTDIVKNERILGRAEKVSFFAENIGYIDGYIYRPQNSGTQKLPVIFNFHGGGMVLGYCEQDGGYCQLIADKTGSAVINVDYPLAPEYKYPLPVEGTYSFMTQLLAEADKYSLKSGSVQLMGHSAGGYLAAALCVMNSDKKQCEINAIALNYPLLSQQEDPSRRQAKDLSKAISLNRMKQYFNWYFDDPLLAREPMASPILAEPACFPPVLINAAGYDSLCGEEKEFAGKLSEAGKEARCLLYPECMHGFTHACFTEYSGKDAEKAWNAIAVFLKEKR